MRGTTLRLAAAVFALGLVAAACGGGDEGGNGGGDEGGTISIKGESANNHGEIDVGSQTSESLEADDFYFKPTVLKGSGGQTLTIEIENEGDAEHNFSISEQQIDQDIDPGGSAEVDVTFPASGELVFFCKYHRSQGMLGALEAG